MLNHAPDIIQRHQFPRIAKHYLIKDNYIIIFFVRRGLYFPQSAADGLFDPLQRRRIARCFKHIPRFIQRLDSNALDALFQRATLAEVQRAGLEELVDQHPGPVACGPQGQAERGGRFTLTVAGIDMYKALFHTKYLMLVQEGKQRKNRKDFVITTIIKTLLIPERYYVRQAVMNIGFETLRWIGDCNGVLELIDQRLLPQRVEYLKCENPQTLFEAIQTLAVRGAPATGVAAAYGVCLGLRDFFDRASIRQAVEQVEKTTAYLTTSRPTAVNLFWALGRMKKAAGQFAADNPNATIKTLKQFLLSEAKTIENEDKQMCLAIGRNGQPLIPDGGTVLTHCNAGALATAGIGTALSPMYLAHQQGKKFTVYVDETRPLLQGARLTAWELTQAGISAVLICDNMAASLMKAGKINAVFTGADRIAANGDTANKIGTLALSILCRHFRIPFYVAAPSSTFDLSIPDGSHIPIEQRQANEVRGFAGQTAAPANIIVYNPAFDVTDAKDITAIITERGVIHNPSADNIRRCL